MIFNIFEITASVGLIWILEKLWLQAGRGRPFIIIYLAVVILSALLSLTRTWIVPGGPFVSIHAEFLPVVACASVMALAVRRLLEYSVGQCVALFLIACAAAGIIGFIIENMISFWRNPFARGAMLGW